MLNDNVVRESILILYLKTYRELALTVFEKKLNNCTTILLGNFYTIHLLKYRIKCLVRFISQVDIFRVALCVSSGRKSGYYFFLKNINVVVVFHYHYVWRTYCYVCSELRANLISKGELVFVTIKHFMFF